MRRRFRELRARLRWAWLRVRVGLVAQSADLHFSPFSGEFLGAKVHCTGGRSFWVLPAPDARPAPDPSPAVWPNTPRAPGVN